MTDLTGKTFGFLKVLRKAKIDNKTFWICACRCGNEKTIKAYPLINGNTRSCGCWRKTNCTTCIDLIGKRFGRLTVIAREREDKKRSTTYLVCRCDCGNIARPQAGALKSGRARSCGCLAREIQKIRFQNMTGNKNYAFNPELTQEDRELAKNRTKILEYKKLKNEIIERDKFCQCCGILPGKDIKFSVHHLKIWKDWPEARLDINNMIYLCNTCHEEFHWEYGDDFLLSEYDFQKFKKNLLKGARNAKQKY